TQVGRLAAYQDGGVFSAYSADGSMAVVMGGGRETWSGVSIRERRTDKEGKTSEVDRIALGEPDEVEKGKPRNFSLRFPATSADAAKLVAGFGESKAGTGALIVGDAQGNKRASMIIGDGGKGILGVHNTDNKAILTLGEAVGHSGGSLAIG